MNDGWFFLSFCEKSLKGGEAGGLAALRGFSQKILSPVLAAEMIWLERGNETHLKTVVGWPCAHPQQLQDKKSKKKNF